MKKPIIFLAALSYLTSCSNNNVSNADSVKADTTSTAQSAPLPDDFIAKEIKKDSINHADALKLASDRVTVKKDEFAGVSWIEPKSKPAYRNRNGMYCYFAKDNIHASNFRFVIQYSAADWLFIKSCDFIIDGQPFSYTPDKVDQDNGSGGIWEWTDQIVAGSDVQLIRALAYGKSAKVRFVGTTYTKDKSISAAELKSIREMLDLYSAMGGTL